MFLGGCRNRVNRGKGPHAVGNAQSGKGNKGELPQLLKQGRLPFLGREVVEIDGDAAGMPLQARRVAPGEKACGGEGQQDLLFCLVVSIFAVLPVVGPNRIRHDVHIGRLSIACWDFVQAYPPFEFRQGERADRVAGRNFGKE